MKCPSGCLYGFLEMGSAPIPDHESFLRRLLTGESFFNYIRCLACGFGEESKEHPDLGKDAALKTWNRLVTEEINKQDLGM
ncbi:MAG: hypothetical protein HQL75_00555 [Magnetococcales bacterium]|nr:hypothetical protein [Magnetococcales bacterium]